MGAIKKMVEEELPGIYVLSLMIGKTIAQVHKLNAKILFFCQIENKPIFCCGSFAN